MDGQMLIKMCLSKFLVLPWSQQLLSSINRRTRTKMLGAEFNILPLSQDNWARRWGWQGEGQGGHPKFWKSKIFHKGTGQFLFYATFLFDAP